MLKKQGIPCREKTRKSPKNKGRTGEGGRIKFLPQGLINIHPEKCPLSKTWGEGAGVGMYNVSLDLWCMPSFPGAQRNCLCSVTSGSGDRPREDSHKIQVSQKTREGCGYPKFSAGKVFRQISALLENDSPIFRQREMLFLPRFAHFPARKTGAGKLAAPAGTLLDFLL